MELEIATVATGWAQVLDLYRGDLPVRIATRHGVSFDIPGLTVRLTKPDDLSRPPDYMYPELIRDYRERLFGDQRDKSLLHQRLRAWPDTGGSSVDQIAGIEDLLRRDPNTRSAAFSTWQPASDLGGAYPVSPVNGCFRLLHGTLTLFLTARSLDVWVGFVPELLAFAQLVGEVAVNVDAGRSAIVYHCWSAHLYEVDYLSCFVGT